MLCYIDKHYLIELNCALEEYALEIIFYYSPTIHPRAVATHTPLTPILLGAGFPPAPVLPLPRGAVLTAGTARAGTATADRAPITSTSTQDTHRAADTATVGATVEVTVEVATVQRTVCTVILTTE